MVCTCYSFCNIDQFKPDMLCVLGRSIKSDNFLRILELYKFLLSSLTYETENHSFTEINGAVQKIF